MIATEMYSSAAPATSLTSVTLSDTSSTQQSRSSNDLHYSSETVSKTAEESGTTAPSVVSHDATSQPESYTSGTSANSASMSLASTAASTPSTSAGLSTEVKAGIGIGIGIGVATLLLAGAAFLYFRSRQLRRPAGRKWFWSRLKQDYEAEVDKCQSGLNHEDSPTAESSQLEATGKVELSCEACKHELEGKSTVVPELDGGSQSTTLVG